MSDQDERDETRHSQASDAELIADPNELASAEARNVLRQIDEVATIVEHYVQSKRTFKLRTSTVLHLHRFALEGISSYAGLFRPAGIKIGGSKHQPVGAYLVPELIEEMCDYVNDRWLTSSPIHLAAYVLWRLNWIHPFTDGNGRTARACSYLVFCLRLGFPLYGPNSVPAQIAENKQPYYEALEAADRALEEGKIDVSQLEQLLEKLLARQLLDVLRTATGPEES